MTKERKIYAALLSVAVAALAADKLFFAPAESEAAGPSSLLVQHSAPPHPHPVHQPSQAANPLPPSGISTSATSIESRLAIGNSQELSERLRRVSQTEHLQLDDPPDLFRAPDAWQKAPAAQVSPAAQFLAQHKLVAVVKTGHGGLVVLEGRDRRSVRVGQTIDGFRLVAVGEGSATFQAGQDTAQLKLPAQGEAANQATDGLAR